MKKMFNLKEIKCPWLLATAMLVFILVLFVERYYSEAVVVINVIWCLAMAVALLWAILNYVLHLKINSAWGRHKSIDAFVGCLSMGRDEKEELRQYLTDFARDLEDKGTTHEEAVQTAIRQFQVREFAETQGAAVFEKSPHFYLLGWAVLLIAVFAIFDLLNTLLSGVFVMAAIAFMAVSYGIALFFLFFIYKLIDNLMPKK